ncbi:TPA: ProQ/FINO family protein [Photobacterium damselae]
MNQRKILTLGKNFSTSSFPNVIKNNTEIDKALKLEKISNARSWLISTFPYAFNPQMVRPLEIGIHKEIVAKHKEQGGCEALGFGWHPLKRALKQWTSQPQYISQLAAKSAKRFDLDGLYVDDVSDKERLAAKRLLKKMQKNRKQAKPKGSSAKISYRKKAPK